MADNQVKQEDAVIRHMKRYHRCDKGYCVNGWQSVRTKLIVIMILLMGFVLMAFWFMNYAWLSPFYESSKVKALSQAYKNVDSIVSEDTVVIEGVEQLSETGQLKLNIIDETRVRQERSLVTMPI